MLNQFKFVMAQKLKLIICGLSLNLSATEIIFFGTHTFAKILSPSLSKMATPLTVYSEASYEKIQLTDYAFL